ncbi:MAG: protein-disulfide isomerase [Myxococcota bacterium]|jgi:protein-disulfide isomerase
MRSLSALLILLVACDDSTSEEDAPTTEGIVTSAPAGLPIGSPAIAADISPDAVVATWDGGQITYGELHQNLKAQLIQMESEYLTNRYAAESSAVEQMMIEKMLEAEATKRGLEGIEALLKIEVEDKVTAPTEEEIQEFYTVMQRQLRGAPLESVRDQVVSELVRRQQAEIAQAYIGQIKEAANGSTSLPFPDLPRVEVSADDDPFLGTDGAPITIIQFAEFQCPYCGKAGEAVDQVLENYPGQIKMVYRDFPLSFHDRAIPAAVAANCAGEQDKYWEMHRLLMSNQRALEESDLTGHATALSLDMAKWNTCRVDPAQEAEVNADMEAGAEVGVSGTPAFFINGIMLSGAMPYERFQELIDRELERG